MASFTCFVVARALAVCRRAAERPRRDCFVPASRSFPVERAIAGNPRLASPTARPADRPAFFAAYALEPFDQVVRKFCALPPLPVRAAGKVLSPEMKARVKKVLKRE